MNRQQAEALIFRLRKPDDRFTTPQGASGIILRLDDNNALLDGAFLRENNERVLLNRFTDEEIAWLLPDHVRREFKPQVAA